MKRQRLNWQEKVRKNVRKIMDFEHVKAVFEEYLNGYDRENDKVKLKIVHTYGVILACYNTLFHRHLSALH